MSNNDEYRNTFELGSITVKGHVLDHSGGVLSMAFEVPGELLDPFTPLSLDDTFINKMAGR